MIAEFFIGLSLVGLGSSIGERHMSDRQKEAMQANRNRLQSWIEKAKGINFSQRIRQRRVVLAMSILPVVFAGSIIWLFPKAIVGTIVLFLALSAICAPLIWWLSRSRDDRSFVIRFAAIILIAFVVYQATMYWLVRDIEGMDELLLYGPLVIAFKIFFVLVFGFVFFFAFLPVMTAQLVSLSLRGADFYLQHCIRNNRSAFIAVYGILGAAAAVYVVMRKTWS